MPYVAKPRHPMRLGFRFGAHIGAPMPEGIDLPFPTAERQAEIEDELRLIYGDLRDPAYKALREYRVRQMVRAGRLLLELRTAKQGKWVCYLDHRTLPFCRRTAFNYIDRAYLHDVGGMEFATIANLRTPEVQHAAHQLRGSLHDAALAKQRRAAGEQRVHTLALFLNDKLTPEERRSVAADLTRCEAKALFDAMCDCAWPELPRAEPASEPPQPAQREPGLTHLLLDCGAYTAFKSDVAIDLEEYCGFL